MYVYIYIYTYIFVCTEHIYIYIYYIYIYTSLQVQSVYIYLYIYIYIYTYVYIYIYKWYVQSIDIISADPSHQLGGARPRKSVVRRWPTKPPFLRGPSQTFSWVLFPRLAGFATGSSNRHFSMVQKVTFDIVAWKAP